MIYVGYLMYMFVARVVSPPGLSSQTARMYYFNTSKCEKFEKTIVLYKNTLKIKYNFYYNSGIMLLVYLCLKNNVNITCISN